MKRLRVRRARQEPFRITPAIHDTRIRWMLRVHVHVRELRIHQRHIKNRIAVREPVDKRQDRTVMRFPQTLAVILMEPDRH